MYGKIWVNAMGSVILTEHKTVVFERPIQQLEVIASLSYNKWCLPPSCTNGNGVALTLSGLWPSKELLDKRRLVSSWLVQVMKGLSGSGKRKTAGTKSAFQAPHDQR